MGGDDDRGAAARQPAVHVGIGPGNLFLADIIAAGDIQQGVFLPGLHHVNGADQVELRQRHVEGG